MQVAAETRQAFHSDCEQRATEARTQGRRCRGGNETKRGVETRKKTRRKVMKNNGGEEEEKEKEYDEFPRKYKAGVGSECRRCRVTEKTM